LNATQRRLLELFRMASQGTGFSAAVLYGIWAHETNSGASRLWLAAMNPAGIKYVPSFFITQAFGRDSNKRDARYPNESIAVAALVFFLRQERYAAARDRRDVEAIRAIGSAGFVEHVPGEPANWIRRVSLYAAEAAAAL
jgi:hypothetical protein